MTDNEIIKAFASLYKKLLDVRYALKITAKEFKALNSVNALVNRQQAENKREHKIVCDYAQAARTIELYLREFCDKKLPYDEMIADAARKASAEIERLTAQKMSREQDRDYWMAQTRIARDNIKFAKSEAIKEFADRLKCNASILCDKVTGLPCSYTISNYNFNRLVKELTEGNQ